jgi:hypothetical protein
MFPTRSVGCASLPVVDDSIPSIHMARLYTPAPATRCFSQAAYPGRRQRRGFRLQYGDVIAVEIQNLVQAKRLAIDLQETNLIAWL